MSHVQINNNIDWQQLAGDSDHFSVVNISLAGRIGFKGRHARDWLAEQVLVLPDRPNKALLDKGCLIARLSDTEYLLQALNIQANAVLASLQSSATPNGVYRLPRQHSHGGILLLGEAVPERFSTLCAVDLRAHKFANGAVAQTSVASANAIIVRCDHGDSLRYLYLFDSSLEQYIYQVLTDLLSS